MITVGVLALQGAFNEHIQLLRRASQIISSSTKSASPRTWKFLEVRTASELSTCDALIIPGGESTTISLVAERSNLLTPLRDFVKVSRNPTWGTCAGLILLSSCANRTKSGGQELIGGLDVRVSRNHFGRQAESFPADLELPFLNDGCPESAASSPFRAIFIRAPVVEEVLVWGAEGIVQEAKGEELVVAPAGSGEGVAREEVRVLARLKGRRSTAVRGGVAEEGEIVAVRQANVFGTSFHPELTGDPRIHIWWLERVVEAVDRKRSMQ